MPRVSVFGVLAVTVILAEPLNETPLIVRAVCSVVAVAALPVVDEEVVAFVFKVDAFRVVESRLSRPSKGQRLQRCWYEPQ